MNFMVQFRCHVKLPVAHGREQFAEALLIYMTSIFLVETAERILDYIFRVSPLQSLSE